MPVKQRLGEVSRSTSLGRLHGDAKDFELLAAVQSRVTPADTLFVYPYRPSLYFLTGARNPTRYSFLQPGMFPEQDEQTALAELAADPPLWVFYTDLPESAYLRIWPSSNRARLHFRRIENFLKENYHQAEGLQQGDLQLLRRNTTAEREPNRR